MVKWNFLFSNQQNFIAEAKSEEEDESIENDLTDNDVKFFTVSNAECDCVINKDHLMCGCRIYQVPVADVPEVVEQATA